MTIGGSARERYGEAVRPADLMVVILAGGEGRRMGGEKPLRCLGGVRLIDHAVRLARRFSDDVRVSVRDRCQISDLDTPLLIDDVSLAGPLAGL